MYLMRMQSAYNYVPLRAPDSGISPSARPRPPLGGGRAATPQRLDREKCKRNIRNHKK